MTKLPLTLTCALVIAGCATARFHTVTDPGGCRVERIALEDGAARFQFNGIAPDGRSLAIGWERGNAHGAYLLDLRSGASNALPPILDNAVSFSPDGRKLVAAVRTPDRRTEILELDRASGATRVVASDPSADFLPSYSRDMTRLYFNSYRTGASDLYVVHLATGRLTRLTTFDGYDAHAQVAPDGTRLAFHRNVGNDNYEIVMLALATGEERVLASAPGEDAYPAWSPDGRRLVFSSDRGNASGQTDLYLMDPDGQGVHRLTTGARASYGAWAPNGRDIYFVSKREGHGVYRLRLDRRLQCAPVTR